MSKSICYRTGSNNILSNPSLLVFRKKVGFLGWQIHLLPSFPTQGKAVLSREQSCQNQSSVSNRYWQSKEPVPIGFRVLCSIMLFYQQNALLEITDTNSCLLMRDRDTYRASYQAPSIHSRHVSQATLRSCTGIKALLRDEICITNGALYQ